MSSCTLFAFGTCSNDTAIRKFNRSEPRSDPVGSSHMSRSRILERGVFNQYSLPSVMLLLRKRLVGSAHVKVVGFRRPPVLVASRPHEPSETHSPVIVFQQKADILAGRRIFVNNYLAEHRRISVQSGGSSIPALSPVSHQSDE
ncbi:unnamed protein product [Leptosia nina]|uniref:Uncharacterized protein n=1 Tax=Leptosia nina TaxID=320188 RepID=A0AAV1JCI9_9NEOP